MKPNDVSSNATNAGSGEWEEKKKKIGYQDDQNETELDRWLPWRPAETREVEEEEEEEEWEIRAT